MTAQCETCTHMAEANVLCPGDRLIIRVDPRTSRQQVAELVPQIRERLPNTEVVVLAVDQLLIQRGEQQTRAHVADGVPPQMPPGPALATPANTRPTPPPPDAGANSTR